MNNHQLCYRQNKPMVAKMSLFLGMFIFLAGWLLSVPPRAAQKGLRQQTPGAQQRHTRPRASQRPLQRRWILMEAQSKHQWEAQLSSAASRDSTAGASRTAQTSTRTTRGPASAVSLPWKDWTLICVRTKGMKVYRSSRSFSMFVLSCSNVEHSGCTVMWSQGGPRADSGQKDRILQNSRRDRLWEFFPRQTGNSRPDQR